MGLAPEAGVKMLFVRLALAVLALLPARSLAAAESDEAFHAALMAYDTVQVAEGIYAFIPLRSNTAMVSGSSLAVIGEGAVLVVDSGHFPSATRRMIAQIRSLTPAPVRNLVNTHWHGDHIRGNGVYREAFPAIAILATPNTRELLQSDASDEPGVMRDQIREVGKMLESGRGSSGKPLTEESRTKLNDMNHELEATYPEIAAAPNCLPSLTFERQLEIHLGKRVVQVMFLGRGNTGGDAVVYVPDSKVLMTGDLVVYPVPYAFGSFIGEWAATMARLSALDAATIVPGHGPLLHDKAYLALLGEVLGSVASQVHALAKQGLSLEETRRKVDVEPQRKQFAKGSDERAKAFDGFFLAPAIQRAYREATEGQLQDENPEGSLGQRKTK